MIKMLLDNSLHMFSPEHFIAVGVVLLIILGVYLSRNYFIKNKTADLIMRWVIAFALMGSEFILRFNSVYGKAPIVMRNIPIPLCGMLLWISAIALLSNSTRIMKRFYPIFLTAATLSLIVCEVENGNFPDFRAFQYFICHGGFLLGALYFVFTKKINKFDFKDFAWSCLIIGGLGGVMSFLFATNRHVFPDDFYVMGFGLDILRPIYDAVGQIGFSLLYITSIAGMMFIFSTLTYYLTKNRKDEDINVPEYRENKYLDYISKKTTSKGRAAIIATQIIAMLYIMAWQAVMGNMSLDGKQDPAFRNDPTILTIAWLLGLMWFVAIFLSVLNDVVYYYELRKQKNQNNK